MTQIGTMVNVTNWKLDGKLEPWFEVSLYKFNHTRCNPRFKVLVVHSEHGLCDKMDHTCTSWFTVQVVDWDNHLFDRTDQTCHPLFTE